MAIERLSISNLRNIAEATLSPSPRLNLIIGANGSGKTSLLEAIYLLSTGRSFRANRNQQLIRDGSEELLIFCETHYHGRHRIGLKKSLTQGSLIHLDGQNINSSSLLAQTLPVLLINPEHHRLIEDGPPVRRAFLDWGLFHVKHDFLSNWKQYERNRKQRNAALRLGKRSEVVIWHEQMARSGESIHQSRLKLCEEIIPITRNIFSDITENDLPITLHYQRGWHKESDLLTVLQSSIDSDLKAGYTQSGPQRADLQLRVRNQPVDRELSRGEQKLLIFALRLALLTLLDESGVEAQLLIDDLSSELDEIHRHRLFDKILTLHRHQIFITATEESHFSQHTNLYSNLDHKMFHVKQGHFSYTQPT